MLLLEAFCNVKQEERKKKKLERLYGSIFGPLYADLSFTVFCQQSTMIYLLRKTSSFTSYALLKFNIPPNFSNYLFMKLASVQL